LFLYRHNLWQEVLMMIRSVLLLLALSVSATAQEAKDQSSASVQVAPAAPVDPVKKKAEDIDKLFAELHKDDAQNPALSIGKIWTLWESNQSPTAELLLSQSNRAMRDGAFETSEEMLDTVLETYPDYTEALHKRAMLYYNMARYDDALEDINAVLEVEPRHFGALAGRAAIFQAQGQVAKAAATLREAIEINPHLEAAKEVLKYLENQYPDI
jgi:tetratricopeptide (TPR) repeat protein